MSDGLVSVIIPTWNRAECLPKTIDSALSQTYASLEAIVIDDGSTDNTEQVIASMMQRDRRIRYIRQANSGVASARNTGLSHARGNYVAFLDSDDLWEPWKLELQIACLKRHPTIGMVWTDMTAVDPNGRVVHKRYLRRMYAAYRHYRRRSVFSEHYSIPEIVPELARVMPHAQFSMGDIFSQMITGNLVHTSTVVLTRERFERIKSFNPDYKPIGEDYDFHLRTCREGPVGFINVPSIHYQIGRPDQLTKRSNSVDLSRNFLRTIEPLIMAERHRINLPESLINGTLAYGYRWLGTELLLSGNKADARTALSTSMKWRWSPTTAALIGLCSLPATAVRSLRRISWPVNRAVTFWREELRAEPDFSGRRT